MDRTSAISFIAFAVRSHPSAIEMVGTAVAMALVSPPWSVPGLGSNVSSWLGPPAIQSKMHAIWRLRISAAWSAIRSGKLMGIDAEAARPAVPSESVWRKCRRVITPAPFIATCTISFSSAMDVCLTVSHGPCGTREWFQ